MRRITMQGDLPIQVNPYNEYYCAGRHVHDFLEIKYVISGIGTHVIEGYEFLASGGDLFFIGLGVSHYFRCKKETPVMVYNLNVKAATWEKAGRELTFDKTIFQKPYFAVRSIGGQMQSILEEMHTEGITRSSGCADILYADLLRVLTYIHRGEVQMQTAAQQSADPIYNVVSFLDAHYAEDITLKALAEKVSYNPTYLSRRFVQIMGVGISEYVHRLRVHRACVYLRESDKSFLEIAGRVGYTNENYFRSVFRRITGKNPKEYRRESRIYKDK